MTNPNDLLRYHVTGAIERGEAEAIVGKPAETIDITPTWCGILPALLAAIEDGTAEGRKIASAELRRMAEIADLYVAEHKEG